jgi:dihydrofolate reductase
MRKIILNVAVSLDNYIEGPGGEYDWCFTDSDYGMNEFLSTIDTILFGRKSYDLVTASFPGMWKEYKHYVFSNTLRSITGDAILINDDVESTVQKMKQEQGKDIWLFGGASLASYLMKAGLIDDLLLAIHPVLLGAGKPLFEGMNKRNWLKLLDCKTYENGLIQNRYSISY